MEIWVPVRGYEGSYSVSNRGEVKSHERVVMQSFHGKDFPRKFPEKILKQCDMDGYCCVTLYNNKEGKTIKVHTLVAVAFYGDRPEGLVTRHLNDDKLNNWSCNIGYGTIQENVIDKFRNGYKTHLRKLPDNIVKDILNSEESSTILGKKYLVSPSTIQDIRKGKFYKEIFKEVMG